MCRFPFKADRVAIMTYTQICGFPEIARIFIYVPGMFSWLYLSGRIWHDSDLNFFSVRFSSLYIGKIKLIKEIKEPVGRQKQNLTWNDLTVERFDQKPLKAFKQSLPRSAQHTKLPSFPPCWCIDQYCSNRFSCFFGSENASKPDQSVLTAFSSLRLHGTAFE